MNPTIGEVLDAQVEATAEAAAVETVAEIDDSLSDTTVTLVVEPESQSPTDSLDFADRIRSIVREELTHQREAQLAVEAEIAATQQPEPEPIVVVVEAEPEPEPDVDNGGIFGDSEPADTAPASDEAPPVVHPYFRPIGRRKK